MENVKESGDENKNVPNSSGSSSNSKELSMTLPEEAVNNYIQGKRHMLVHDYTFAVQNLATACEMYVNHYGELAIECGEVLFLYGKALFRLSQQQAGVLGGAINEGSNEDENSSENESKENESEKNSEDDGENEIEGDKEEEEGDKEEVQGDNEEVEVDKEEKEPSESTDSPPVVLDEGSSESKSKEETSKSTEAAGSSHQEESAESSSNTQVNEDSKMEEGKDESQAEEDDLELAWNTLETAKSIFKRKSTVDALLKVAEILQLLAEISMESDNNPAAINDLKECLQIQEKHLEPDDRILAETYYQMGLAQMLDKMYPEALENFQTTKQILRLRRQNLKNTPVDETDGTFQSADIEAEITDLDTILVDIQEKIDDTD